MGNKKIIIKAVIATDEDYSEKGLRFVAKSILFQPMFRAPNSEERIGTIIGASLEEGKVTIEVEFCKEFSKEFIEEQDWYIDPKPSFGIKCKPRSRQTNS